MLSKMDFFTLPELRNIIYPHLSLLEHATLLSVSNQIKEEVMQYLENQYKGFLSIAFDCLYDMDSIDVTDEIKWIKSNLPFQQFLKDYYQQYQTKTFCLWDDNYSIDDLKKDQIILKLEPIESLGDKIRIASDICYDLIVFKRGLISEDCEKIKEALKNKFRFIFNDNQLETKFKKYIDKLENISSIEKEEAVALYLTKTIQLHYWSSSTDRRFAECVIPNTLERKWTYPLTLEQLKPFESEIKNRLGRESIERFMATSYYRGYAYIIYKNLFNQVDFQYCYCIGKINHYQVFHNNLNLHSNNLNALLSVVKQTWLSFDWLINRYNYDVIANCLFENPSSITYLNNNTKCKEMILSFFEDYRDNGYLHFVRDKQLTLEECIKFRNSLSYFDNMNNVTRHELELFCQGLGSTEQYNIGLAIKALQDHEKLLNREKIAIEYGHEGFFALISNSFFKEIYGDVRKEKCDAIKALVAILRKKSEGCLSKKQIDVLTQGIGTEQEDALAKIVRTMLLEPLQIKALEDISIDDLTLSFNTSKKI